MSVQNAKPDDCVCGVEFWVYSNAGECVGGPYRTCVMAEDKARQLYRAQIAKWRNGRHERTYCLEDESE